MAERGTKDGKFSDDERAALKEYAAEKRKGKTTPEEDAQAVLDKIAQLPEPDRSLAQGVHDLALEVVPGFAPKLWYGMPAYAYEGKTFMWFQPASKFKARYAFIGFSDKSALDDGDLFPVSFAITALTPAVTKELTAILKRSVG